MLIMFGTAAFTALLTLALFSDEELRDIISWVYPLYFLLIGVLSFFVLPSEPGG